MRTATVDLGQALQMVRQQPTVRVEVAAVVLDVSPSTAYQAIRDGQFPVPVIKIGERRLVVPTAPLRQALHVDVITERAE